LFKDAFQDVIKTNFETNLKVKQIDQVLSQNNNNSKDKKQVDNKDFVSKGEQIIDVQSVAEGNNQDGQEKNLKELMDEMDSTFNKKLEQNFQEKDLNKIQSNIFKKEKVHKDKSNLNNNNHNSENKTAAKAAASFRNNNRNIKF